MGEQKDNRTVSPMAWELAGRTGEWRERRKEQPRAMMSAECWALSRAVQWAMRRGSRREGGWVPRKEFRWGKPMAPQSVSG